MAVVQSLPELLGTLTNSLTTLSTTLPSAESIIPPTDGISLLDSKNELFLSYLQNLVFLILLKLRHTKGQLSSSSENDQSTTNEVVKKLVELRVYLDRGVKPLENKLRYQIDKAVRAADDHASRSQRQANFSDRRKSSKDKKRVTIHRSDSEGHTSDSADSESASDSASEAQGPISQSNLASFARPSTGRDRDANGRDNDKSNGVYRPPRIAPVAPPMAEPRSRRPAKSRLLDDYITSEFSAAPVAEPSIGANIIDRGRRDVLSERERRVVEDRQRYEEENLVRLPGMGKKEKRRQEGERAKRGQFGGEEWSGLGGSADRIVELTRGRGGSGKNALERSRKRGRDEEGTGGGGRIGDGFERKRRALENGAARRRR